MSRLAFLDGWKIELSKLPKYPHFEGTFKEKISKQLLQLLYDSDELKNKPEIKATLKNVIEATKNNTISVNHYQNHKCGRFYCKNSISLIPLSKLVKHTCFKYHGWSDIDMIKLQRGRQRY